MLSPRQHSSATGVAPQNHHHPAACQNQERQNLSKHNGSDDHTKVNAAANDNAVLERDKVCSDVFPFMGLPVELRLEVYSYLLIAEKPIIPRIKSRGDIPRVSHFPGGAAMKLLTLNKQVSTEAREFLYSQNVFQISVPHHRAWLASITPASSFHIRSIQLDHEGKLKTTRRNLEQMMNTLVRRVPQLEQIGMRPNWHPRHDPNMLLQGEMKTLWAKFSKLELVIFARAFHRDLNPDEQKAI
ncbi:hypothetical protein B0T16DRAFT_393071 [Cercophora newfieldiana]|uniref:Uncharacterized protein n=1 Tax=Cercophora newfieldiana TaxID=92897 RepID=A0AA39XWH0_9PEZI|nr:hypothetical protein B0T16DRAFT_393071 [Cercophora newfieldiana]